MSLSIDFETFYSDDYSLRKMTNWLYVMHPTKFDAYLVSCYDPERGIEYVGHPKNFDWSLAAGQEVVMHNATFDGLVIKRLQRDGVIPVFECSIMDTADLATHLRAPRNLKDAAMWLLGVSMDKTMRDKAKGVTAAQMDATEGMTGDMKAYAMMDAKVSYDIWMKYRDQWPAEERELSRLNREAQWRGVPVDREALKTAINSLDETCLGFERAIPWSVSEKLLSPKAIRAECRKVDIPAPASFSKKDPDTMAWMEKYSVDFPWVAAVRDYRSANNLRTRFKALLDATEDEPWYRYTSLYQGALASGRFSAGFRDDDDDSDTGKILGKFNMYNMPKKALFGCDLRGVFQAPKGFKLIVADFAQIEARLVLWRAGETSFLQLLREEGNLYQAYAKARGMYKGHDLKKDDKTLYQFSKVNVLSCGYQCGWLRYQGMAQAEPYFIKLTEEQAREHVAAYRSTFPLVPKYWAEHQKWLLMSAMHKDDTHRVPLVSGRHLTYFDPRRRIRLEKVAEDSEETQERCDTVAKLFRGGVPQKLYGGLLTGHEIQGTARDVMRNAWLACEKAGYPVLFTVYDELVFLVPDTQVPEAMKEIPDLMTTTSPFVAGCPMGVEIQTAERYFK